MQGSNFLTYVRNEKKELARTLVAAAFRSSFIVLLFVVLFTRPINKEPVTNDDLLFCWTPLALYSVGAVVLIVRYFPKVAHSRPHKMFYYLWDLGLHAALLIVIYALIYKRIGLVAGSEAVTEPMDFLYFSIVTWTTLGYGDVVPVSGARMFAASEALCGYVFMGLYLAIVLYILTNYGDAKSREQSQSEGE